MAAPQLPPELQLEFDAAAFAFAVALHAKDHEKALEIIKDLNKRMFEWQASRKTRYHKGYPLHNIGYTLVQMGSPYEALRYFILAYIEDVISEDVGDEDKADATPAGQTLHESYQIKAELLQKLKEIARDAKRRNMEMRDPEDLLDALAHGRPLEVVFYDVGGVVRVEAPKREPGQFKSRWGERVFIGGSYQMVSDLNHIKQLVAERGYDPIIAWDFIIPSGLTRHHSLMLLHECKYAIFEVTQIAGQLIEIERSRDYEVIALALCQGRGQIGDMLATSFNSAGIPLKRYDALQRLRDHINEFLPRLKS